MTRSLILLGILVAFGLELRAAAEKRTVPNYGQLQTAKFNNVRNGFAQPDLLYAPFAFWFWDEPVEGTNYPGKTARMAKDLLEQGINPGYAHPRVSMADYQAATGKMVPSPSLPREQWLSKPWFDAFEDALQQAELRRGCFGYCDEYMWPSGRAAGRVMQKHPELANASLEWEVTDVAGGTQVEMSASFFSVAAQLDQKPDVLFSIPFSTNSFPLADLIGVDLFGHESLGQTVTVERERLVEISLERACWKEASKGRLKAEVRLAGPEGRLLASQYLDGGIGRREIALPIAELLPVGTVLYVAVIPGPGFPQNEVGWWCKTNDVYAGGNAFANGKLVAGDRHVKLSYRLKPDLIQGNWIWHSGNVSTQHTCFFRKSFELNPAQMPAKALARVTADNRYKLFINGVPIGQGEDWSKPGSYDVTSALHSGRNIVGLEAGGDGGLDAVLFDLKLAIPGGEELHVSSDGSWLFSRSPGEGWNREGFDDMAWQTARVVASADAPPWNLSAARLPYRKALIRSSTLQLIGSGDKFSWTAPSNGYWRIYTFKKAMGGDVNMLDHRLAAAFIEIAHKPYADRFGGRMGKSIPGVFCDTEGSYGANLPWSESLAPHYRAKTGRDVRLYMPLMLDVDVEGVSARARFDWFEAVSDLYAGYFAEIDEWLRSRGMYYISNLWEENLLWVTCVVGDPMKLHRAFSMPGMDCLFKSGYDVHDFKEVSSVAEFEGRRMMTEMMGAAGWNDFNPITVKEISNCLFAWGVSHVVPHGVFMSRGLEGNPWLPDWYDRNPMWSKMHLWSDFIRRASYVNSHGSAVPDVLMLTPITSVWTLMNADDLWGPNGSGNLTNLKSQPESMAKHIEWVYSDAIRALAEYRIQYLISDRHYVNQMRVDGP
ncbi:MAG: glycosyl hydrolase, partial [Verrucomicrobia bacterium]|nr:glycosyl hydrolase [Verrucomicrobiota bacterium]